MHNNVSGCNATGLATHLKTVTRANCVTHIFFRMKKFFKANRGQFPSQNAEHPRRLTIPLISQIKKTKAPKSFKRCGQSHTAVTAKPKRPFGPLPLLLCLHPAKHVVYFFTKFKCLTHSF